MTNIINGIKTWLKAWGVEGWVGLILGIILWISGLTLWAGVAFGVFACKNWEWIKKEIVSLWEKLKDKKKKK